MFALEIIVTLLQLGIFLGLGLSVQKTLQLHLTNVEALLVGAGLFSLSIGCLGGITSLQVVVLSVSVYGLVGFFRNIRLLQFAELKIVPFAALVYLLVGLCWTLYPSSYFDPLNYHLFGAIKWADLDRLSFVSDSIQIMHNSYADYLLIPAAQLFGRTPDELISLLVSSQLLTFIVGVVSFSTVFSQMFLEKYSKPWLGVILVAVLTRASLQHKAFIAKNDWIALSWFLAGALPFYLNKSKKHLYVGAFLLGLSVGSKFTYVLPALGLFMGLYIFTETRKGLLWTCLMISIGSILPYFIRNLIWTGNPLFPLSLGIFPSGLGPSWSEGMKFFSFSIGGFDLPSCVNKLKRIFTYEPLILFFPFAMFFKARVNSVFKFYFLFVVGIVIFFMFGFGPNAEMRHFGPVALAINFFAVWTIYQTCSMFKFSENLQKILRFCFLCSLILNPMLLDNELNPVPESILRNRISSRLEGLYVNRSGYALARQMHGNESLSKIKIGIIDDTPPYFFTANQVSRIWDDPQLDTEIDTCLEINCVLKILQKNKFTHLIDTGFAFDPYYRPHILSLLRVAVIKKPESVVLDPNNEKLISLQILSQGNLNE